MCECVWWVGGVRVCIVGRYVWWVGGVRVCMVGRWRVSVYGG